MNTYIVQLVDDCVPERLAASGYVRQMSCLRRICIVVSDAPMSHIKSIKGVRRVSYDTVVSFETLNEQTLPAPAGYTAWQLGWLSNSLAQNKYLFEYTGRGVDIYIPDDGLRLAHDEFKAGPNYDLGAQGTSRATRIYTHPDFVGMTYGTHSTGCMSIAAGLNIGVARDARIFDAVCGTDDVPIYVVTAARAIAAHNAIIEHHLAEIAAGRNRPAIITNSYIVMVEGNTAVAAAFDEICRLTAEAGIFHIKSGGNTGIEITEDYALIGAPRVQPELILVGGIKEDNGSYVMNTSQNYGPLMKIYAPSTLVPHASTGSNSSYTRTTGTSLAAPLVAGTLALMLESEGCPVFSGSPSEIRQQVLEYGNRFLKKFTRYFYSGYNRKADHPRTIYSLPYSDDARAVVGWYSPDIKRDLSISGTVETPLGQAVVTENQDNFTVQIPHKEWKLLTGVTANLAYSITRNVPKTGEFVEFVPRGISFRVSKTGVLQVFKGQKKPVLQGSHPLAAGLVHAYLFNEFAGYTIRDHVGAADANLVNAHFVSPAPTWFNAGIQLTTRNDDNYAIVQSSAWQRPTTAFTFLFDYAPADFVGTGSLGVSYKTENYKRGIRMACSNSNTAKPIIYISGDGLTYCSRLCNATHTANTRYIVCFVFDGTNSDPASRRLDIYVNGELSNGTLTNTIPSQIYDAGLNYLLFRAALDSGESRFLGKMYTALQYNRALTTDEIALLSENPAQMFAAQTYADIDWRLHKGLLAVRSAAGNARTMCGDGRTLQN